MTQSGDAFTILRAEFALAKTTAKPRGRIQFFFITFIYVFRSLKVCILFLNGDVIKYYCDQNIVRFKKLFPLLMIISWSCSYINTGFAHELDGGLDVCRCQSAVSHFSLPALSHLTLPAPSPSYQISQISRKRRISRY